MVSKYYWFVYSLIEYLFCYYFAGFLQDEPIDSDILGIDVYIYLYIAGHINNAII